jgi:hypothetical protein
VPALLRSLQAVAPARIVQSVGLAKRMMEEVEARMFWPSGDAVCRGHVLDQFLLDHLQDVQSDSACELCGQLPTSYVDTDVVQDLVVAVIREYRRRAIDRLFHDPETESGYALPDEYIDDTSDAVNDLFAGALDDHLLGYVGNNLEDDYWFTLGVLWLEGVELYLQSWSDFRSLLRCADTQLDQLLAGELDAPGWKHEVADKICPSQILPRLWELMDELEVVKVIPASTIWLRGVNVPARESISATRIGTAPSEYSSENRMNRAGSPMFYGAADTTTAATEIGRPRAGEETIIGAWMLTRPARVLDLISNHELPNFYDVEKAWLRWRLMFLAGFADDVSQPIGAHQLADYRATQVFMDYLRSRVSGIDGIMYRSSRTGERCCALEVGNAHCIDAAMSRETDDGQLWLTLDNWHSLGES